MTIICTPQAAYYAKVGSRIVFCRGDYFFLAEREQFGRSHLQIVERVPYCRQLCTIFSFFCQFLFYFLI